MYEILEEVPNYEEFLTVEELNRSSKELAEKHPHVKLKEIGRSRDGHPIRVLEIGEGDKTALMFGFPHPNEPIGSMMLEFLSKKLAEDEKLRESLGYKFILIKCIDPDGAKLNEGWFKGGFTPLRYALNYYRPPGHEQIEWTFPIDYKSLHFHSPLPETKALMDVIKEHKPQFMFSLHNAGFCGVYYYVGRECPELYPKFHKLVEYVGLPLHKGEPETPFIQKLDEGVFKMFGVQKSYNWIEKNSNIDPAEIIEHGTSSDDYLKGVSEGFCLVCEMPYYYDKRIEDTTETNKSRREVRIKGLQYSKETYEFLGPIFHQIKDKVDRKSKLFSSVSNYIEKFEKWYEVALNDAKTSPMYEGKATVAQEFDNLVANKLDQMLILGMTRRLAEGTEYAKEIHDRMLQINDEFESVCDLMVIPIRKLVQVQLGSALLVMNYL
jgi:hypothetical protein